VENPVENVNNPQKIRRDPFSTAVDSGKIPSIFQKNAVFSKTKSLPRFTIPAGKGPAGALLIAAQKKQRRRKPCALRRRFV